MKQAWTQTYRILINRVLFAVMIRCAEEFVEWDVHVGLLMSYSSVVSPSCTRFVKRRTDMARRGMQVLSIGFILIHQRRSNHYLLP